MASVALNILRPLREDELEALGLFEKFADQEVSFTELYLLRAHAETPDQASILL